MLLLPPLESLRYFEAAARHQSFAGAAHPGIAIEVETNHRGVDPDRRDFDAWFACTGETAAPASGDAE